MNKQMSQIVVVCVCVCLLHTSSAEEKAESRVILDETFAWLGPYQTDTMLRRISTAHFNVIVPIVWHGRGVAWTSQLAPAEAEWEKAYARNGMDPLRYLIARAHSLGIEVHPWFTVALRQREFLTDYYDAGTPKAAFDVHNRLFREFIVALMLEVVTNYDIDGLNMDYVRSMGVCVSEKCISEYRQKYGRDLMEDRNAKEGEPGWMTIAEWNAEAIDEIVRTVADRARRIKPGLVISVSSHAGLSVLKHQGTDSIRWANRGWIDVLFHMEYARRSNIRWNLISSAIEALVDKRKFVLMVGNYDKAAGASARVWPRDAKEVSDLIGLSQRFGNDGNGVALYQYPYLTNSQIEELVRGPFRDATRAQWMLK
ncbi:MAG: hypothetical protein NFCOHLIN_02961 [Gammaproteobacteria bacterium]|nr:hypothetical protein [Gammaproteobacteria bacterium]